MPKRARAKTDELTIDTQSAGRNGDLIVTARIGEQIVHKDQFDPAKARPRARYVEDVCKDRPGIDRDALTQHLLALADERRHKTYAPSDGQEIEALDVRRPELIYSDRVGGITVPIAQLSAGSPLPCWRTYLHWSDGKREVIEPRDRIELGHGRTLWLHPQLHPPTLSMVTSLCSWSAASRRDWLEGTTDTELPCRLFIELTENIAHLLEFPEATAGGTTATISLWVMLTYIFQAWPAVPYLHVSGTKESGKTRLFDVLRQVVFRPAAASNITGPALFRTLHSRSGTLLLDEAERLKQKQDPAVGELLTMLLAGNKRGGQSSRMEKVGDTYNNVEFDVFGPKATACIVGLPPELLSRCITIGMLRAPKDSPKLRRTLASAPHDWQVIRDHLHVMAIDHFASWPKLARRSDVCPEMSGREYEKWQPLLAIARWLDDSGMSGLHARMEHFALDAIDTAIDDGVPDMEEVLLQALLSLAAADMAPKASEVLEQARQADNRMVNWSAKGVQTALARYGFRTHRSNGTSTYRVTPEDVDRLSETYGIRHP